MSLPEVPPNLGYQLEYFLKQLRTSTLALLKDSPGAVDDGTDETIDLGGGVFSPVDDTAATLADQGTGTENAWTTVTPTIAESGARFAIILCKVNSTDNADTGNIKLRTNATGIVSPILAECVAGAEDAKVYCIKIVRLDDAGSLQYLATVSAGNPDWSIEYMGYSL